MAALHFDANLGLLPPRLTLRADAFDAAYERYRAREELGGRRVTLESLYDQAGVSGWPAVHAGANARSLDTRSRSLPNCSVARSPNWWTRVTCTRRPVLMPNDAARS